MATIRIADPADAAEILSIYRPYIEQTSITFETETPSIEAFADRITHYLENFPWLVCETEGTIIGYAYASRHRERTAYQWSVESSVYVQDDYMRTGVAATLYTALFEILKEQGVRNVYAGINLPNDRSVAFHEKLGFVHFATYEQVGYKLGKWKNVGWWRLILNDFNDEPDAPVPLRELDMNFLASKLIEAAAKVKA